MKKIKLATAALLLITATSTFAQNDNYKRFEVSYASTNMDVNEKYADPFDNPFIGVSAGLVFGKSISSSMPLFLEYGANLTFTGRTFTEYDDYYDYEYEDKYKFLNIAVPLNLAYKVEVSNDVSLQPFVGLNFKVGLMAKDEWKEEEGRYSDKGNYNLYNSYKSDDNRGWDANRFQFGMNVGVGLNFQNGLYIGYRFQPDFGEFAKETTTKTNLVTVGVNF